MEEGSAQTERGSGDDCDDEDGCEASGEENGESYKHKHTHTHTNIDKHASKNTGTNISKHTPTHTYTLIDAYLQSHLVVYIHTHTHTVHQFIGMVKILNAAASTYLVPAGKCPEGGIVPRDIYPLSFFLSFPCFLSVLFHLSFCWFQQFLSFFSSRPG